MTTNVMTQMVSTSVDVRASFGMVSRINASKSSFKDAVNNSLQNDNGKQTLNKPQDKQVADSTDNNRPSTVKADKPGLKDTVKANTNVNDDNVAVRDFEELPDDKELAQVMEELASIMANFANEIATEILNVPLNEVTDYLDSKNLDLMDLLSKNTDFNMVMDFAGLQGNEGLLTDENAFAMWSEISVKVDELYDQLQIPNDDEFVTDFINRFKELTVDNNTVSAKFDEALDKIMDREPEEEVISPVKVADASETEEDSKPELDLADNKEVKNEAKTETKHEAVHTNMDSFFNKLSDAVNKLEGAKETFSQNLNTADVLNQVMDHIRTDISETKTSMEFMLHPESLGKVSVQVESNNGTMTAKLTCENQVAKENLEAQLTTLKQTFEEQGLKVESVEINVSDFNFTRDEEEKKDGSEEQSKKKRRTFTLDEINARLDGNTEPELDIDLRRRIDPRVYGYRVDYFG